MHYRLIIIVLIILMFPVNVFSKQDLSAFFVNVFDDQTIKIPTGIYTINKTIDIVNRQNITISGDGLVLVIVNNVKTAFNLKESNYIFFKNLIILDKSDELIFINNDQRTVLGINGMLFFREKGSNNNFSRVSRHNNSTYNSFLYDFSNSLWGDMHIINSIKLNRRNAPYNSEPTDNKTHQTKYNRTDFTSIDPNFLSKVLFTYVNSINMGLKHDNFGWVELFLSDEYKTFANNNNKILSDLQATLVKDQFESTKDHEIRVKNVKRKMIDQNLKFEKDLAQFMISFVEKKEAKNKHLVNKDIIALRKSLKRVEFDKLVDVHYDADRHLYNISSENHAFQCSVKPNDARQLTSGINKAKISGFSRQEHGKISYSDLHIIDGVTGNKYPCGHLRELAPKELKTNHDKVSATTSKAQEMTTSEKQKIFFFQPEQTWRGNYTCNQGRTNLDLNVTEVYGNSVTAVFDFNFNNRERGSFLISGEFKPATREIVFKPQRWINQHSRYSMVGMTGKVSDDGKKFNGKINFSGCSSFDLSLLGPDTRKSESIIRGPKQW